MNDTDKINYFRSNILTIIKHESNIPISFIADCSDVNNLTNILCEWPDEIKILIVDSYILLNE